MKKYILASALLTAGMLGSCSLDETPKSAFDETEAFKSSTLIYVNTVSSVYTSISSYLYGGTDCVHTLGEFTSDATMLPGRQGDWVDGGKWQQLFLHNFMPATDLYNTVWTNMYSVITQCNISIDKLKEFEKENPVCSDYIYEVRALRSIMYLNLLDIYGSVPYVTSSEVSASSVKQSSRQEIFNNIVSELNDCLPHLSEDKCQNTGAYYGRVTKGVVLMALAKLAINAPVYTTNGDSKTSYKDFVGDDMSGACLASEAMGANVTAKGKAIAMSVGTQQFSNCWEAVIYCANELEKMGYGLEPNYSTNFSVSNESSKENIWVRPNSPDVYQIFDFNPMRSWHYNHAGALGYSGWNGACSTVRQMQVFGYTREGKDVAADPRLAMNFFYDYNYTEQTGAKVNDGATTQDLEYLGLDAQVDYPSADAAAADAAAKACFKDAHVVKCGGARMAKYAYDAATTNIYYPNNDLVIWRYADAVLLKAEAEYRLGRQSEALTDVNIVRARVNATPRTSLTLNDILDERMLELCWEGTRRQDQIRFCTFTQPTVDRYVGVWHNAVANNYNNDTEGYTCLYPIPYSQLSLNTNLKQNPGY